MVDVFNETDNQSKTVCDNNQKLDEELYGVGRGNRTPVSGSAVPLIATVIPRRYPSVICRLYLRLVRCDFYRELKYTQNVYFSVCIASLYQSGMSGFN